MKLLIENYLSIFLVTICAMLCTSFIRSELEINNARDFHSYCIAVIEASDFDTEAMNKCKEEATKRGYELNITSTSIEKMRCKKCNTVFNINDSGITQCPNPNCGNGDPDKIYTYLTNRICTDELKYSVDLKLLGIHKDGVLNGYAR